LLLFQHRDVPGIIGSVGTILGNAQVNIAQMAVGRSGREQGGAAVGVLNLDSLPDAETLKCVEAVSSVESVRIIKLPAKNQFPRWMPSA
jgi:D-3-phosphoglycerate dehydrogenase